MGDGVCTLLALDVSLWERPNKDARVAMAPQTRANKGQPRVDDEELARRRVRFLVGERRALFHIYATMPEVFDDLKKRHGYMTQKQLMWTMGRTPQDWYNHFTPTKEYRRGPSFSEIQGFMYAWEIPPGKFKVDFEG